MNEKEKISPRNALQKIYQILRLDRQDISAIYMFAILAGIVQLSLPLGIQTIIGFVMAGSMSTTIVVLIAMVVTGTFLNGLLQVKQLAVIEKIKQKIFLRYGLEFGDRLPKLDIEKLDRYFLPELVNRFFDTISLQKGLEKLLLDLPTAIIQIMLGLLLLSFYHPVFIGFGIALLVIVSFIIQYSAARGLSLAMQSSDEKYRMVAWLQEMARSIKSFKYSQDTFYINRTDDLIAKHLDARTNYFKILLIQFWSLISFKVIITASMLIVGAVLLVQQQINVGQFIAADIVIITIIGSVEKLILSLDNVFDAKVSMEKLGKVTEAEKETSGSIVLGNSNSGVAIQFTGTAYSYPNGEKILRNLNLDVAAGNWVQVAGKSGSGKSTLLRLLTGAYKNFDGQVLIDGQPIGSYNLDSLRSVTGVLLKSGDIFQGSLWDNLTMGNTEVKLEEVTELAEKIGLSDFIQSDKKGLYRELDSIGKSLPGHVKQKILLVRAIVGRRRLLLLEDPFQYLNEAETQSVIRLLKGKQEATVLFTSENVSPYSFSDQFLSL
jgi:ATP-binding cassette, subfamily B, bacterial